MNRLPLPISTIKRLCEIRDNEHETLWVKNPVSNCLQYIGNYDYDEAIEILGHLKDDYPDLMDYNKEIRNIKTAKKRYLAI